MGRRGTRLRPVSSAIVSPGRAPLGPRRNSFARELRSRPASFCLYLDSTNAIDSSRDYETKSSQGRRLMGGKPLNPRVAIAE